MRIPQFPPDIAELLAKTDPTRLAEIFSKVSNLQDRYLHWDKLRHYAPPDGLTHKEWWLSVKLSRTNALKAVGLLDKRGQYFRFAVPEPVLEKLHQIDLGAGGLVSIPEQITNPNTRDRYLMSSLVEEAITSSQLEGAVTTREVAKEMIRTGRRPRDTSERMILNNFHTMQRIREWKSESLSPQLVFQIHELVTRNTLADASAAGRFRNERENIVVGDEYREVFHDPPHASELRVRMEAMCAFANGTEPTYFVHPAVRAIILHFWLAYDHPFVDGNGRTARALFYWAMLHSGYWLFEFVSISSILRKAPSQYGRAFLYTETDGNDLTYFLVAQAEVIGNAIRELHAYIDRKTAETREIELRMRALDLFNHRQVELIRHALKHPGTPYSFASHQKSHNIVYQTARTDLLNIYQHGLLERRKKGNQMLFVAPADLAARLNSLQS